MDLITKYKLELSEDTKLDELNLKEKQLMLPNIKHKWVSRLMNAKHDFIKYKAEYKKSIETIIDEIKKSSPTRLSDMGIKNAAEQHPSMQASKEKIFLQELLIEYLEDIQPIFKNMSFDIKNTIDIIKLETL